MSEQFHSDRSIGNDGSADRQSGLTRRQVLINLTAAIAAAALAPDRRAETAHAEPVPSGIKTLDPAISALGTDKLSFFSPEEKQVIAAVADLIIPTDQVSPGARAAGVHDWIDFAVANSPQKVQLQWREGLAALDHFSSEKMRRKFLELDPAGQQKLLEQLAEREDAPLTPSERFFLLAKEATVNGFYTSEIGLMKDLRYQGGSYVAEPVVSCPAVKDRSQ